MNLKVRLYFEDDQNGSFMGIGLLWLLEGIKEQGSIRKAAQDMDMSYTKAFQILKKLLNYFSSSDSQVFFSTNLI